MSHHHHITIHLISSDQSVYLRSFAFHSCFYFAPVTVRSPFSVCKPWNIWTWSLHKPLDIIFFNVRFHSHLPLLRKTFFLYFWHSWERYSLQCCNSFFGLQHWSLPVMVHWWQAVRILHNPLESISQRKRVKKKSFPEVTLTTLYQLSVACCFLRCYRCDDSCCIIYTKFCVLCCAKCYASIFCAGSKNNWTLANHSNMM